MRRDTHSNLGLIRRNQKTSRKASPFIIGSYFSIPFDFTFSTAFRGGVHLHGLPGTLTTAALPAIDFSFRTADRLCQSARLVSRGQRFPRRPMAGIAVALPMPVAGALVAYGHSLTAMVCFGALVLERRLIRPDPDQREAGLMVITDAVYGIAALTLLLSGILRVLHFGQGSSFYTQNPLFWWKVGTYVAVGALSLYPTFTFIPWTIPLRRGEAPPVGEGLARRLRWIVDLQLLGFATIPLLATLVARGVGLTG